MTIQYYQSTTSADSAPFVNPVATYHSTPLVLTDGQTAPAQADSQGALKVYLDSAIAGEDLSFTQNGVQGVLRSTQYTVLLSAYSPNTDASFGSVVTRTVTSASTSPVSFTVTNANAAVRYFQLYNATSAGGTPVYSFPIPAGTSNAPGSVIMDTTFFCGKLFSNAMTWGVSTNISAYSGATASDHVVNLNYV